MRTYTLPILLLGALAGCGANGELVPAPGANALPAPDVGAFSTAAGVRLEVRSNAWNGLPQTLPQSLTPLLVHITNDNRRPVMIRYADFTLQAANGKTYAALPPFDIDKTITFDPRYTDDGFALAPYLGGYYPRWRRFDAFPAFDRPYWSRYYPEFVQLQLPTPDMLRAALPEGVVQPGGTAMGFLYFQHVPASAGSVTLAERLETTGGASLGDATIPFQVR